MSCTLLRSVMLMEPAYRVGDSSEACHQGKCRSQRKDRLGPLAAPSATIASAKSFVREPESGEDEGARNNGNVFIF